MRHASSLVVCCVLLVQSGGLYAQTRPAQKEDTASRFEAARSRIAEMRRRYPIDDWYRIHDAAVEFVADRGVGTVPYLVEFLKLPEPRGERVSHISRRFALMCLSAMGEQEGADDAVLELLKAEIISGHNARAAIVFMPPDIARRCASRLLPWVWGVVDKQGRFRTLELERTVWLLSSVGDAEVGKALREEAERRPADRDIFLSGVGRLEKRLALSADEQKSRLRDELLFCQAIEQWRLVPGAGLSTAYALVPRILDLHHIRISESFLKGIMAIPTSRARKAGELSEQSLAQHILTRQENGPPAPGK